MDVHVAARSGDIITLNTILQHNPALAHKETDLGTTPLFWAVANGQKHAALILLQQGADVNAKNRFDSTPLHWAADVGNDDILLLLIEQGANLVAKDNQGRAPIDRALSKQRDSSVALLRAATAAMPTRHFREIIESKGSACLER